MVLWILATVAAFFIKGVCGFANTLVFTSILAFGITNVSIYPVELLLGYPSNIILTWKNRARLRPGIWIPLSLLVLAGSFVGTLLLKNVNPGYIKIIFGVVVILLGIEMLLRESRSILPLRKSPYIFAPYTLLTLRLFLLILDVFQLHLHHFYVRLNDYIFHRLLF